MKNELLNKLFPLIYGTKVKLVENKKRTNINEYLIIINSLSSKFIEIIPKDKPINKKIIDINDILLINQNNNNIFIRKFKYEETFELILKDETDANNLLISLEILLEYKDIYTLKDALIQILSFHGLKKLKLNSLNSFNNFDFNRNKVDYKSYINTSIDTWVKSMKMVLEKDGKSKIRKYMLSLELLNLMDISKKIYEIINCKEELENIFRNKLNNQNTGINRILEWKGQSVDILDILNKVNNTNLSFDEFKNYLNLIKKEDLLDFEPKNLEIITLDEFGRLIFDKNFNNIIDYDLQNNELDNNHYLNDYYIFSSHNTYLIGHQLYGNSSLEAYIKTLEVGCKYIEIDLWVRIFYLI